MRLDATVRYFTKGGKGSVRLQDAVMRAGVLFEMDNIKISALIKKKVCKKGFWLFAVCSQF